MNLVKLKLLFISLFCFSSLAVTCPSNYSVEKVAKELIKLELSGLRVDGMQEHKCLNQNRHPYLLVSLDASNDESSNPNFIVETGATPKIVSVKAIDKYTQVYEVKYSFKAKDAKSGKSVSYVDKIVFNLYKDARNISINGCAAVLEAPEKIAIFKECRN
jgi:hypothetical protein